MGRLSPRVQPRVPLAIARVCPLDAAEFSPMKLLVFAHTPPPHHGQSYMVKLMLDGLGGDCRRGASPSGPVHCYHVNARLSDNMEDIGTFRLGKLLLIARYCLEAIWCRFRYGVRVFYYVPAPGKRAALYRDWLVMLLCRPFFRHFVHHWHAAGLGDWVNQQGNWIERTITRFLLGKPSLGLALAISGMRDALWFNSRSVEIVPNGIPDPCPDFTETILPRRRARLHARQQLLARTPLTPEETTAAGGDPHRFRVLYLAHALREKGLFDALDGVVLANAELERAGSPLRVQLTIAGAFLDPADETEFRDRLRQPSVAGLVDYAGFVSGDAKRDLLSSSDCLCFPTYYHAESFGLVVVEAMAAGMSIVTTRWRALPDLLPADHTGFVPIRSPADIATALQRLFRHDSSALRNRFLNELTCARHIQILVDCLLSIRE
jgi:glycosyltransferase involved in cell wall biosynthesis